jgi:cob(I)alamin adenosyltransferase
MPAMPPTYTGTGDDGSTGLLGEGRVPKHHRRIAVCGDLDEASAALGLARSLSRAAGVPEVLMTIQRDLYGLMAEVASLPENAPRFRAIDAQRVAWLEQTIRRWEAQVSVPTGFILPGDTPNGAAAAVARTVVRRAERGVAELTHSGDLANAQLLRYLNRLSSLCFVLELLENKTGGVEAATRASSSPT